MSLTAVHALLDVALAYRAAGRAVLPIAPGSKKPSTVHPATGRVKALAWKRYQSQRPTEEQLQSWFRAAPLLGLGIACGPVSGVQIDGVTYGLEVLDIDDVQILEQFVEAAHWQGLGELLARLLHQRTPRPAGHFGYLCQEWGGNTKLAQRQDGVDEHGTPLVMTLIETRGDGGQVIVAPTPPGIHPEHPERGYELVRGSWETLPIITPDERQTLWALARSFNAYVAPRQVHTPRGADRAGANGERPGDTLNETADRAWWRHLLEWHGWSLVHQRGDVDYWQRPGKDGKEWSATFGACGPYLYVFSSNAAPFEPERGYQPFSAFTLLEHGGDFKAAAKALAPRASGRTATDAHQRIPPTTRTSQRCPCANGFVWTIKVCGIRRPSIRRATNRRTCGCAHRSISWPPRAMSITISTGISWSSMTAMGIPSNGRCPWNSWRSSVSIGRSCGVWGS